MKGNDMISERVEGVAIGLVLGFDDKAPLVVFPGNKKEEAIPARSVIALDESVIGKQVALLYEDGDPARPLIIGKIMDFGEQEDLPVVVNDGEYTVIRAKSRIELRCGKASIIMDRNGHITVRGTRVVSHASEANRIRGGSIALN